MSRPVKYQLWFVPTEKGIKEFGWQEQLLSETENKQTAQLRLWEAKSEPDAPDADQYRKYELRDSHAPESK